MSQACKGFYKKAEEDKVQVFNFFLPRKKAYNPKGRYQTQEEADLIAIKLKEWLHNEGYDYEELDCEDERRVDAIIDRLKIATNGFEGMIDG